MLRTLFNSSEKPVFYAGSDFLNKLTSYQSVRWRRKPRWLPMAKSKIFRVAPRKKLPEPEYSELKTLFNHYRTEMKSLRLYFKDKLASMTTAPEVIAEQAQRAEEDHRRCIEINNQWNAEVAKIREKYSTDEKEKEIVRIMEELVEFHRKEAERKEKIESLVRKEKEQLKSFITKENIDEAIESALVDVKDYNFAIDAEGNFYHGRSARPPEKKSTRTQDEVKNVAASL